MIRIVEMVQTCEACPAQWDAVTDTGDGLYLRYRWGRLMVTRWCAWKNNGERPGETLLSVKLNDDLHGLLDYSQLHDVLASHDIVAPVQEPQEWKLSGPRPWELVAP